MSDELTGAGLTAVRIAPGARETAAFLSSGLLTITHLPEGRAPAGGVVICSSLHAEFLTNYRKEVLLARALCDAGVAVQRFHYRGTGNSRGAPDGVRLEMLREDAVAAERDFRAKCGVTQPAILGIRFGALVAASLAEPTDAPLALWEPVLDAEAYFREAFRSRRMRELKDGVARPTGSDGLLQELRETGAVDVLGFTLYRALYDSAAGATVAAALGSIPRDLFLVQISKRKELKREFSVLIDEWQASGSRIETAVVTEEEAWWFVGEDWLPEERRPTTTELVKTTQQWLVRAATEGRTA